MDPDHVPEPARTDKELEIAVQAAAEGHDADLPTHDGKVLKETHVNDALETPSGELEKETHVEENKSEKSAVAHPVAVDVENDPEKLESRGSSDAEDEQDPNVIFWDGDDDPDNPMNWGSAKKWGNIAVISAITFVTPLASSIFAPAVPETMAYFKSDNNMLATFVVSIYLLGFAIGPLVIGPLSEIYGRMPIYLICNVGFIIFTVACAVSTSLGMLIGFRFIEGCFGSAPLTIGGGSIADMVPAQGRGAAMALWGLGPLLGPVIGPVAGGYLAAAKGWRWVFWLLVIIAGAFTIMGALLMRETFAPVILQRRVNRLRKETGNQDLRSKLDSGIPPKELFKRAIVRPTKLLLLSPICMLMSLYMSVVYGIMYILFTTFTYVFEDEYHFGSGEAGLTYIGLGIGMLVGMTVFGVVSDRLVKKKAAAAGGHMRPEVRLLPLLPGSFFVPVGLFIYGWTTDKHVQWAVPLLGTLLLGVGMLSIFMAINTYLVDVYTMYAASAFAANTVLRSLFGALFPLFALQMYAKLGLGWGNSLLGFLALAMCAIPFLFLRYGEWLRTNPKFQVKL